MGLASTVSQYSYIGNNIAFVFSAMQISNEAQLSVSVRTGDTITDLVNVTDYTVSNVGLSNSIVTLVLGAQPWIYASTGLSSSYSIFINRIVPLTQLTDLRNQGAYYPETVEGELDLLVMADQQQQFSIDRSAKLSQTIAPSDFDPLLPLDIATSSADKILQVNATGDGFKLGPTMAALLSQATNELPYQVVINIAPHYGTWYLDNAYYDATTNQFNRVDISKPAFGLNMRARYNLPYEANTTGMIFWRAIAGANPINDNYASVGGWENMFLLTEYRDLVVGGYGIEVDGAGISPYGRLTLSPLTGIPFFGLLTNIYNDYSGVDDVSKPSWRVGFNYTNDTFSVERAAAGAGSSFDRLFSVSSSGLITSLVPDIYTDCRLIKSSSNLRLIRYNGIYLTINNVRQLIPTSGITLSNSGVSASTLYYIYAYMSGSTMTLERSTTTHAIDNTTGIETMSGDATRTFVGLARTTSGSAWADSSTQIFVASFYNRKTKAGVSPFTADATTTSTSYVELNSSYRIEFLCFSDDAVSVSCQGRASSTSNTARVSTSIGFDGTTAEDSMFENQTSADFYTAGAACTLFKSGLSEGYHYTTVLGHTDNAAYTGTWQGSGTQGQRFAINALISG